MISKHNLVKSLKCINENIKLQNILLKFKFKNIMNSMQSEKRHMPYKYNVFGEQNCTALLIKY
jgi:hypothetical protein